MWKKEQILYEHLVNELKHDSDIVKQILSDGIFCSNINYIQDRIIEEKTKLNKIEANLQKLAY